MRVALNAGLLLNDRSNGMRGGTLFGSHKAETLVRSRLDRDLLRRNFQNVGNILEHRRNVLRDFRPFKRHSCINVDNGEPVVYQQVADVLQQQKTRYPLVAWIGIREVFPDVSEPGCAEERIHDGVEQDVGVGVSVEPFPVRDLHSAKDQLAPFGKAVDVVSESDAGVDGSYLISNVVNSSTGGFHASLTFVTSDDRGPTFTRWINSSRGERSPCASISTLPFVILRV